MRQLKQFMRNRKKEMLACGPCECRTLQCWRYANENCGCGEGENSPTAKYTFKDWDGTILKTGIVNDLETPIPPEDPTRESTAQYNYTFIGWEPEIKKITKNTTYIAKYEESVRSYTVTIISNDVTMGTVDESSLIVEYGTALSVNGNVLTIDTVDVTATAEAGYVFSSWGELPATVTEDLTIIATFEAETPTQLTLTITPSDESSIVVDNMTGNEVTFPVTVTAGQKLTFPTPDVGYATSVILKDGVGIAEYQIKTAGGEFPTTCNWTLNGEARPIIAHEEDGETYYYYQDIVIEGNINITTDETYSEGE